MEEDSRANQASEAAMLQLENNPQLREKLIDFLAAVDTGIHSVGIRRKIEKSGSSFKYSDRIAQTPGITNFTVSSFTPVIYHKVYDGSRETGKTALDLDEESGGTIKMYHLAVKVIEVLEAGHTLIVDELDTSIHPLVSSYLLELFKNHWGQVSYF